MQFYNKVNKDLVVSFLLGFLYFLGLTFTLTHYGINWDTINHLPRGQSYLHYFLTGRRDYLDLPKYFENHENKNEWYWQNPDSLAIDANIPKEKVPTRSVYQITDQNLDFFLRIDGDGHPPLSDILSSVFNRIFFAKLRIVNDIDSYRLYGVFLSSCLVGLIYYWISKVYGRFAGLMAALFLASYPLFWSESHFNTEKDIPETVFWAFMIFSVWKGTVYKNLKWIILSGLFFGLALGTKFNILFIPFVILPWFLIFIIVNRSEYFSYFKSLKYIFSSVFAFLVGIFIFVGSWPYLWADPISKIQRVFGFYKTIGTGGIVESRFLGPFGTTTYPIQWILYTTPLVILVFLVFGFIYFLLNFKKDKNFTTFLILIWFLVPIIRVVWKGASIYGGIRQIMEFIPPIAILAGIGAAFIFHLMRSHVTKIIFLVVLSFGLYMFIGKMIQIHPNENQYFNELIGGLSGAKENQFPYWGFTLGAPYRYGISWINKNAEYGANLSLVYELIPNIPRLWVRPDINFHNANRSGYLNNGEYAITLVYDGTDQRSYYDTYLDKYVNPVYSEKVDNVSVLNVWKNDKKYLKKGIVERVVSDPNYKFTDYGIKFDLGDIYKLWRLEINYDTKVKCKPLLVGYDETSIDDKNWTRIKSALPEDWRISYLGEQPKNGNFVEPFVGQEARYINLFLNPIDTCLKYIKHFKVFYIL